MNKITLINDYYNNDITNIDTLNDYMTIDHYFNKKYMCMRCFYQTNDYLFLKEHLFTNCKKINGNHIHNYIFHILEYKS
jgi:hypothetical protein